MCEVNWVLLTGFVAAIASAVNAALLFWMILVTRRYVNANVALLEVNRGSLHELRKQYAALVDREIRPYKNLLDRAIRNLEEIKKRDLVYAFENRDGVGWVSENELLPPDYNGFVQQAMSFDADLYTSLNIVYSKLIAEPSKIVAEMQRLGRSGRSTLEELPQLQADLRMALDPIISLLRSTRDNLLLRSSSNDLAPSVG